MLRRKSFEFWGLWVPVAWVLSFFVFHAMWIPLWVASSLVRGPRPDLARDRTAPSLFVVLVALVAWGWTSLGVIKGSGFVAARQRWVRGGLWAGVLAGVAWVALVLTAVLEGEARGLLFMVLLGLGTALFSLRSWRHEHAEGRMRSPSGSGARTAPVRAASVVATALCLVALAGWGYGAWRAGSIEALLGIVLAPLGTGAAGLGLVCGWMLWLVKGDPTRT